MSASEGYGLARSHAASGQGEPVPTSASPDAAWAGLPMLAWAQTAPVALALLAGEHIAWVNPAFEALTGTSAARAIGCAPEPLLADVANPAWLPPAGELARRRLQRADGTALACDVQCDPVAPGLRL